MFSLEEQIANYADVHFNAEHNAQYFFSTNAETEVTRQLNELAGIQVLMLQGASEMCPR
jgi:hypothetical protein